MSKSVAPRLTIWPFLVGDFLLVGFAAFIVRQSDHPLNLWQASVCLIATLGGAWLFVIPFLQEYQAAVKLCEADTLATTVAQIQNLEQIKTQIAAATAQWQAFLPQSATALTAAHEITDRMKAEMGEFSAFLKKANDAEKNHLRLEVEKLRRSEGEWLQLTVHILDHVFALHKAASHSGHPALITQLDQFQFACRDIVRRRGLVAFAPAAQEPFDAETHQVTGSDATPSPGTRIAETLAPGYTYQGPLVRRALVRLEDGRQNHQAALAPSQEPVSTQAAGPAEQTQAADLERPQEELSL
jgi:molecular chaperone GrpE (heat shock protein)